MEGRPLDLEASLSSLTCSTQDDYLQNGKEEQISPERPSQGRCDPNIDKTDVAKVPEEVRQALTAKGLAVDDNGVVSWSELTKLHPRRWSTARKTYNSAIICFLEFFMTLISNAGSTIVPIAAPELEIGREMGLFYFTTLYLLGQAVGGVLLPPLTESYASSIYTISTFGFSVSCVIIGARPLVPVIAVFRFISGFLSAMPAVVAAGNIENMWNTKARIWVIHVWICGAVIGLAFAPSITTGVIESSLGWFVS